MIWLTLFGNTAIINSTGIDFIHVVLVISSKLQLSLKRRENIKKKAKRVVASNKELWLMCYVWLDVKIYSLEGGVSREETAI